MASGTSGGAYAKASKGTYVNKLPSASYYGNNALTGSDSSRNRTTMKLRIKATVLRLCGLKPFQIDRILDEERMADSPMLEVQARNPDSPEYTDNPLQVTVHTLQGGRVIMARAWDPHREEYRRTSRIIHEDDDLSAELRDMIVVNELTS